MNIDSLGTSPLFKATKEEIDLSTLEGNLITLKRGPYFGDSLTILNSDGSAFTEFKPASLNSELTKESAGFIYNTVRLDFIPSEPLYATYQFYADTIINNPAYLVEAAKTSDDISRPVFYSVLKDVPEILDSATRKISSGEIEGTDELNAAIATLNDVLNQIYVTKEEVDPYILETLNVTSYQTKVENSLSTSSKDIVTAVNELNDLMLLPEAEAGELLALGGSIQGDITLPESNPRNLIWEIEITARVTADFTNGNTYVDALPNDFIVYDTSLEGYKHYEFGRLINRLTAQVAELNSLINAKQNIVDNNLSTISKVTVDSINELYHSVLNIEVPTLSLISFIDSDLSIVDDCAGTTKYWVINSEAPVRVTAKWSDGIYNKEVSAGDIILYERIAKHCLITSDNIDELRTLHATYKQTKESVADKVEITQPTLATEAKTVVGAINEILTNLISKETIGPSMGLDSHVGFYNPSTVVVPDVLDYLYPVHPYLVEGKRPLVSFKTTFPNGKEVQSYNRSMILKGVVGNPDVNEVLDPIKNTPEVFTKLEGLKYLSDFVSPSYLDGSFMEGMQRFHSQIATLNETVYHPTTPANLPADTSTLRDAVTEVKTAVEGKLRTRNVPMLTPLFDIKELVTRHGESKIAYHGNHIYLIDETNPDDVTLYVYVVVSGDYSRYNLVRTVKLLTRANGELDIYTDGTTIVVSALDSVSLDGVAAGLTFVTLDLNGNNLNSYSCAETHTSTDANLSSAFTFSSGVISYIYKSTKDGGSKLELGEIRLATKTKSVKEVGLGLKHINDVLLNATVKDGVISVIMNGAGVGNKTGVFTISGLTITSAIMSGLDDVITGDVKVVSDKRCTIMINGLGLFLYSSDNLHAPKAIVPKELFTDLVPHAVHNGLVNAVTFIKANDASSRIICAITEV